MGQGISCCKWLSLGLMAILLVACASSKLKAPGPDVESILVIPFQAFNSTPVPYGFSYEYQLTAAEDPGQTYQFDLYLPGNETFMLIDSLPPGTYYLQQVAMRRAGDGSRTGEDRAYPRNDLIVLQAGKITIFGYALFVSQSPSGTHGGQIFWKSNFRLEHTNSAHRDRILKKLGTMKHFGQWKVLESHG